MNGRTDTGRGRYRPGSFASNRRGSVLLWLASALPVILGMSGLGFDATLWYMERRITQAAADSAALAAVYTREAGGTDTDIRAAVLEDIARNEIHLRPADSVTVNTPPATGPNTGDAHAIEVLIDRQAGLYFTSEIFGLPFGVGGRAVGGLVAVGQHCVVGLEKIEPAAVEFDGTADARIGCGVISNSSSGRALVISGSASFPADPAQAVGGIEVGENADLVAHQPVQPFSRRVADPYGPEGANLQLPSTAGCVPTPNLNGGGLAVVELDPAVWCGDLDIDDVEVTFNPGTYVVVDGDIKLGAGATLNGTDVTFVLAGSADTSAGSLRIAAGAAGVLSAPNSGPMAGILFYQDPEAGAPAETSCRAIRRWTCAARPTFRTRRSSFPAARRALASVSRSSAARSRSRAIPRSSTTIWPARGWA